MDVRYIGSRSVVMFALLDDWSRGNQKIAALVVARAKGEQRYRRGRSDPYYTLEVFGHFRKTFSHKLLYLSRSGKANFFSLAGEIPCQGPQFKTNRGFR